MAPPDSPGTTLALVSISPVNCSEEPLTWSWAVMDCPRAVSGPREPGVPPGAFGVPDDHDTVAYFHRRRVSQFDCVELGSTAEPEDRSTSCERSYPTTVAL